MAEFGLDACPRVACSLPASRRNARHSRSRSEPACESSYAADFLQSKLVDTTQDKTRRWSCMLQGDVDVEHRRKRRVTLEQDVRELEMRLQNEKAVRRTLEKALRSSLEPLPGISRISPETKQLIKEIASLEVEVVCLEQHVLSLYRKLFETKLSQGQADASQESSKQRRQKRAYPFQHRRHVSAACDSLQDSAGNNQSKTRHASLLGGNFSIDECRSSDADNSSRVWPDSSKQAERTPDNLIHSNSPALLKGHFYRSPNLLSEEMVRCMASIYCNLADPPLQQFTATTPSPPFSTPTSSTNTSREASSDGWSPSWKESVADGSPIVEVPWIRVNKERLSYAARALRNFRSMVEQLAKVHPNDIKNDEKVAFWINIYNALVMHAYLAYGIPRSHLKRVVLLQKAAYKVGAHSINAYTIEQSILGCRPQRPAQWLQALFSPLTKFKTEERRAYALNAPEPLVCFAICSGGRSDPPVRLYTPTNVKSELKAAKREFLHANLCVKDKKVMVPKLVESFARDAGIAQNKILDWIMDNASEEQQELLRTVLRPPSSSPTTTRSQQQQLEWLPYDFSFRYSFSRELARTPSSRRHSL